MKRDREYYEAWLRAEKDKTMEWQQYPIMAFAGGLVGGGLGNFITARTIKGKIAAFVVETVGFGIIIVTAEAQGRRDALKRVINDLEAQEVEEMLS